MKPGSRLKSVACDTEVIVIRGAADQLECGGATMVDAAPETKIPLSPEFSGGTLLGKRYVDADGGNEFLCTKGGAGSLSIAGLALSVKDAKPLPASD